MLNIGKYRILSQLYRRNNICVFKCICQKDVYVVKILCESEEMSKNAFEKFTTGKVQLLQNKHPNVAEICDYGLSAWEGKNCIFYSMEYVDGPSLKDLLDSKYLFNESEVIKIGLDIAETLYYLQQNFSSAHSDIKPASVMLDKSFKIKLTDFGKAKFTGALGFEVNEITEYIAPEDVDGGKPDYYSDIYSLGAILFHMLTGGFPGKKDVSKIKSKPIVQIIEKMLAKKKENRCSCKELVGALKKIKKDQNFPSTMLRDKVLSHKNNVHTETLRFYSFIRESFHCWEKQVVALANCQQNDSTKTLYIDSLKSATSSYGMGADFVDYIFACEDWWRLLIKQCDDQIIWETLAPFYHYLAKHLPKEVSRPILQTIKQKQVNLCPKLLEGTFWHSFKFTCENFQVQTVIEQVLKKGGYDLPTPRKIVQDGDNWIIRQGAVSRAFFIEKQSKNNWIVYHQNKKILLLKVVKEKVLVEKYFCMSQKEIVKITQKFLDEKLDYYASIFLGRYEQDFFPNLKRNVEYYNVLVKCSMDQNYKSLGILNNLIENNMLSLLDFKKCLEFLLKEKIAKDTLFKPFMA